MGGSIRTCTPWAKAPVYSGLLCLQLKNLANGAFAALWYSSNQTNQLQELKHLIFIPFVDTEASHLYSWCEMLQEGSSQIDSILEL